MASLPKISIVTPSFNQVTYIEETILAVLLQGYPNLEFIIIDGGSSDQSVDIIRKYQHQLSYWVSESDRGQSHAINKGFEKCSGEIITFLSSDDTYLPGTLLDVGQRWINRETNYGAIIGGFCVQDEESHIIREPVMPKLAKAAPLDLTLGPPGVYRLHQVSTFYSREALDNVGRFVREDLHYVLDRELLYRVCRNYPLLLVDKPFGIFRRHSESKSESTILPFAREFAQLYLQAQNGNRAEDRQRKRMARHHLAKGFISYAKSVSNRFEGARSLLKIPFYSPSHILKYAYLNAWLHVLGIR